MEKIVPSLDVNQLTSERASMGVWDADAGHVVFQPATPLAEPAALALHPVLCSVDSQQHLLHDRSACGCMVWSGWTTGVTSLASSDCLPCRPAQSRAPTRSPSSHRILHALLDHLHPVPETTVLQMMSHQASAQLHCMR